MSRRSQLLKVVLSALVLLAVGGFFARAFSRSWATFAAQHFQLRYPLLVLAALATAATSLLATVGWTLCLNRLSSAKLSFGEGVAMFNSSSLTKYVPGKVWSYALQMYWLSRRNVPKPLVAYVNLLNLWVSMAMSLGLGLGYLLLSSTTLPRSLTLAALVAVLGADLVSIRFSGPLFNGVLGLLHRLLKREMTYFEVPLGLMLELHLVHLLAALSSGAAMYCACLGIGFEVTLNQALLVMASLLIADVIGFLAVFVPGGLGVREGVMYLLLGGGASGSLAVMLPIASRLLSMLVDVAVGGVALKLLRDLAPAAPADAVVDAPPPGHG